MVSAALGLKFRPAAGLIYIYIFGGGKATPHIDRYLYLLKVRVFARSNWKSLGQDQWSNAYDALWRSLTGYYLSEFKRVVKGSRTQKTDGPSSDAPENGALLIAKQEAIGMWGMLKGLGTSLAAVAGPVAVKALAEDFDETGRFLFGADWDADTKLFFGMNAAQIGTVGGEVIALLISFARTAGAQGGRVFALLDRLRKVTDKAQRLLDILNGLQGVTLSAIAIAKRIEELRKESPDGKITWEQLSEDTVMLDQVVALASGVTTTVLAGRKPRDGAELLTRSRIHILLKGAQIAALGTNLITIAGKNVSQAQKDLESTQVWMSLIPLLFSAALDVPSAKYVKRDAAGLDAHNAAEKQKAAAKPPPDAQASQQKTPATDSAATQQPIKGQSAKEPEAKVSARSKPAPPSTEQAEPAGKTMAGPGQSGTRKAAAERDAAMERIADRHQRLMDVQAEKALGPRRAPQTPEDVRTGRRASRYTPDEGKSVTVVEGAKTLTQARKTYDDVIAETAGKYEVGIWQNVVDGTYAVRLGQPTKVSQPTIDGWRPVQHYHTNAPDVSLWRGPARADIKDTADRVAGTGRPLTEIVEHPLPDGTRGRAAYTVRTDGSITVRYQNADGKLESKRFASMADFDDQYMAKKVFFDPTAHPDIDRSLLADAKKAAKRSGSEDDEGGKTMASPGKTGTPVANGAASTAKPKTPTDEGGVRVPLTKKEAKKRIPHLQEAMEQSGKWTDLPHRDDAIRLGKTFEKTVHSLVKYIAAERGAVLSHKQLTKAVVATLRAKGGRVLFVEGSLGNRKIAGKKRRADYVEIDFGPPERVSLIDLTADRDPSHLAKTALYKKYLEDITGMPVEAMDMRFVAANGDLLDTLEEVPTK